MDPITKIYYFPIDAQGNEIGEPIPVTLQPDGMVNVSKLPKDLREGFEFFGISDRFHICRLFPKDGQAFLLALLHGANGHIRFRTKPQSLSSQ